MTEKGLYALLVKIHLELVNALDQQKGNRNGGENENDLYPKEFRHPGVLQLKNVPGIGNEKENVKDIITPKRVLHGMLKHWEQYDRADQ